MRRAVWLGGVAAIIASTLGAAAQIGGKPATGNPTPGTAQPAPPNLSDRITLTGCLQPGPKGPADNNPTSDGNTPSDMRAVLTSAERVDRVPPGTGGSALAVNAASPTYRLEGLDSQFTPFMNARVEISGEIKTRSANDTGAGSVPTLLVEFVQRINARC